MPLSPPPLICFSSALASMKFPSTSTNTITYLLPLLDVAGKHPVWSLCTMSEELCILMYTSWAFGMAGTFGSVPSHIFVEHMPCH
jgi:hypothetical protein